MTLFFISLYFLIAIYNRLLYNDSMSRYWKITSHNLESDLELEFLILNDFLCGLEERRYTRDELDKYLRARMVSENYKAEVIDFQFERFAKFGNLQIIRTENNLVDPEDVFEYAINMGIYVLVYKTVKYIEVGYEYGYLIGKVDGVKRKFYLKDKDKTWSLNISTLKKRIENEKVREM